jgi:hypothetical protein
VHQLRRELESSEETNHQDTPDPLHPESRESWFGP